MGLWDGVKKFFGMEATSPPATSEAAAALQSLRAERKQAVDPEWTALRNRLGTLVLSEGDQQRLWRRAHRGAEQSARILSGITHPSPEEKRILTGLVDELERGR